MLNFQWPKLRDENTADVGPVFATRSFSHFEVFVHFNNFRSKERLLTVYTMGVMGVFSLRQGIIIHTRPRFYYLVR